MKVTLLFALLLAIANAQQPIGAWTEGSSATVHNRLDRGSCGYDPIPTSTFPFGNIAAPNSAFFSGGARCGECYEIKCLSADHLQNACKNATVVVQVTDQCRCEGRGKANEQHCCGGQTHFKLSPQAFAAIANSTRGVINTQYRRVECAFTGGLQLRIKDGSSEWWLALIPQRAAGPGSVKSVQVQERGSQIWLNLRRQPTGYYTIQRSSGLKLPIIVKVTATDNQVVTATLTEIDPNTVVTLDSNFLSSSIICPAPVTPTEYTRLPQNDTSLSRPNDLALQRQLFGFGQYIPERAGIHGTGSGFNLETIYEGNSTLMALAGIIARITAGSAAAQAANYQLNSLQAYQQLYSLYFPLAIGSGFNQYSDEYFATERLTVFPNFLERVDLGDTLPFAVDDSVVEELTGSSLSELRSNGRLFLVDLRYIDSLPRKNYSELPYHQYLHGCAALFYLNGEDKLMPLAIGGFSTTPLVFTPADEPHDWLLAKIAHNTVSATITALEHFGESHAAMVAISLGTRRQIHKDHPLYGILTHHLFGSLGGRRLFDEFVLHPMTTFQPLVALTSEGSEALATGALARLRFNQTVKERLEAQGVFDLPGYKYRDDAMAVRRIIRDFVEEIVYLYYGSDNDVNQDTELQAWANEIVTAGHLAAQAFPSAIASRTQLVELVTEIIFLVTVQHSARNTLLAYHFHFLLPTHLVSMYAEMPQTKGTLDDAGLLRYLPPLQLTIGQLRMTSVYSLRALNAQDRLGSSTENVVLGPRATDAVRKFQLALQAYDNFVAAREASASVLPYTALSPKNLPYNAYV